MYRILIVDDEALEREGMHWIMTNMVKEPLEIIDAENGQDAIQKASIHKPHIIFMDIRMPGLDGLYALRSIKAELPLAKFVLVTAYDYFDYAQEALRLGAKDYIVKPAKRQEIVALIERLITDIKQEHEAADIAKEREQQLIELIPLVKAELALGLIAETIDEQELLAVADSLQLPLDQVCAVVIAFPESNESKLPDKQLGQHVRQLHHKLIRSRFYSFSSTLVNEHIVLFLTCAAQCQSEELLYEANQLSTQLIESCKHFAPDQLVLIGIGTMHEGVQGARRSYYEAVFASTTATEQQPISLFQHMEHRVPQPLLQDKAEQYAYVQQAITLIRQEREQQTFSIIDAATSYMERNYKRELSLEEVAEQVHLNPYYFSKVFKQQTGETFIDYITRIRIEHAKRWMSNKDISLKEICYLVGYNDPNYFSRVFKKVTGITPSEYRAANTST